MQRRNVINTICILLIASFFTFSFEPAINSISALNLHRSDSFQKITVSNYKSPHDIIAENVKSEVFYKEIARSNRTKIIQKLTGGFLSLPLPLILTATMSMFIICCKIFESKGILAITISYIQKSDGKK